MNQEGSLRGSRWTTALPVAGIAVGLAASAAGKAEAASAAWALTTIVALVPLTAAVISSLRRGNIGVDLIALVAMGGALGLQEYLAGAVIGLMLAGGEALEDYAAGRARRELSVLLARAPQSVHRYEGDALVSAPIQAVGLGDRLLIKPGEVVPVDGIVEGVAAVLDEAALTGEAHPVRRAAGDAVRSGTVNAGPSPFTMRATTTAASSTYAAIVRLVEQAQASKAPLNRLADRYALLFLPVTLGVAASAWLLSGDPVRALTVLVIATPCPLILAAPVAIVGGISRAARQGVIVKGGGALETLAHGSVLVLDKTGTVTAGSPAISRVECQNGLGAEELICLAASLEQVSPHVLARAIVRAARERGIRLRSPESVHEEPGAGVRGTVEGRAVAVGKADWVHPGGQRPGWMARLQRRAAREGALPVFVRVEGTVAGALVLDDPIRSDARSTIRSLRGEGFRKILMCTGDHAETASRVGRLIGVDAVYAEHSPGDKLHAVRTASVEGVTVMVGDGINDAPALAAAHVGVAMGAGGATAASEAADVVLLANRLGDLVGATRIARRARRIALQSIAAGMALSVTGMSFAVGGFLSPVAGAILQEAIDVLVILNAMRALRDTAGAGRPEDSSQDRTDEADVTARAA
jgi:heavy metal translocating P-type ATPase